MKKGLLILSLLAAVATFAWAGGQSEVQAKSKVSAGLEADKAAIANLWSNYAKYGAEGNLDGWLALHERDAYKMPQDQPMFQPWADVEAQRAKWEKRSQGFNTQMSVEPREIEVLGDYAYSMGTYQQVFTPKAGGAATVFDGKFLTVLHKGSDGTWRILRDCYNSNTPPGK